jgi:hypothetical protein
MAMQSHIIKRLETFLEEHDRRLIGWDEILEGGLPPQATVMSWQGTEGGLAAASAGHDVIMSPVGYLYLDYLQTASPNEPPGRPTQVNLGKLYNFEPVPAELAADKRGHILGLQANMFTEHTRTYARLQHNLLPRLAAVAETGWSTPEHRDFRDFLARLPSQLQRYRAWGLAYAQTPFEVGVDYTDNRAGNTVTVSLANPLGYEVRYSTDGQPVSAQSPLYQQPLTATLPATVQAAAFYQGQMLAAKPTVAAFTAQSLLSRRSDELLSCVGKKGLVLRLEDDGPREGNRAVFNVDIFQPCWRWPQAQLDGIGSVEVRAGRIPYYFQLAHDEPASFREGQARHGEMLVRRGDCSGKVLAEVPLPAKPDADGFVTLRATLPKGTQGTGDLCINFTGDTRPAMWVLDEVTLGKCGRPVRWWRPWSALGRSTHFAVDLPVGANLGWHALPAPAQQQVAQRGQCVAMPASTPIVLASIHRVGHAVAGQRALRELDADAHQHQAHAHPQQRTAATEQLHRAAGQDEVGEEVLALVAVFRQRNRRRWNQADHDHQQHRRRPQHGPQPRPPQRLDHRQRLLTGASSGHPARRPVRSRRHAAGRWPGSARPSRSAGSASSPGRAAGCDRPHRCVPRPAAAPGPGRCRAGSWPGCSSRPVRNHRACRPRPSR